MKQALVNGFSMAYRDEGSGPILLLIHAFPLSGTMWDPQIEHFKSKYRVIAPDLRGFGQSGGIPADQTCSMDQYADDLAALLQTLGLAGQPVTLVGLSLGGYIAFAFWRRYAAQVQTLVLCDTRSEPDTEAGRQGRYDLIEQLGERGSSAAAEALLPKLLAPETYRTQPELVAELAGLIERNDPAGLSAASRALAARPDSTPDLSHIMVPVLVVVGQYDGLTPVEGARKMAQALPDWQLSIVPQVGHLSNLENPTFFNRAVQTFLHEKLNHKS